MSISRQYINVVVSIMNNNHVDAIKNSNVSRSVSATKTLNIFEAPHLSETMKFEYFNRPDIYLLDDDYEEYDMKGNLKDKRVDIILFEDVEEEQEKHKFKDPEVSNAAATEPQRGSSPTDEWIELVFRHKNDIK